MSRVGKQPIAVPENVEVTVLADSIEFSGPKGKLSSPVYPGIELKLEGNRLLVTRKDDSLQARSFHGLCRTLAANAAAGVSEGFSKRLEIVGVGYRANLERSRLVLNLGYSKPVVYEIPDDIEIVLEKPTLLEVKGIDKQRVGQEAHRIRSFRRPDPYKLKGIRYVGERLIKKERKAGVSGV